MTEDKGSTEQNGSITVRLGDLGRQLGEALKTAWESEERKSLQNDISEGLNAFGDAVEQTLEKAQESEALKDLKEDVTSAYERGRDSKAVSDVREGIADVLQTLTTEVEGLVDRWQEPSAESSDASEDDGSEEQTES